MIMSTIKEKDVSCEPRIAESDQKSREAEEYRNEHPEKFVYVVLLTYEQLSGYRDRWNGDYEPDVFVGRTPKEVEQKLDAHFQKRWQEDHESEKDKGEWSTITLDNLTDCTETRDGYFRVL